MSRGAERQVPPLTRPLAPRRSATSVVVVPGDAKRFSPACSAEARAVPYPSRVHRAVGVVRGGAPTTPHVVRPAHTSANVRERPAQGELPNRRTAWSACATRAHAPPLSCSVTQRSAVSPVPARLPPVVPSVNPDAGKAPQAKRGRDQSCSDNCPEPSRPSPTGDLRSALTAPAKGQVASSLLDCRMRRPSLGAGWRQCPRPSRNDIRAAATSTEASISPLTSRKFRS